MPATSISTTSRPSQRWSARREQQQRCGRQQPLFAVARCSAETPVVGSPAFGVQHRMGRSCVRGLSPSSVSASAPITDESSTDSPACAGTPAQRAFSELLLHAVPLLGPAACEGLIGAAWFHEGSALCRAVDEGGVEHLVDSMLAAGSELPAGAKKPGFLASLLDSLVGNPRSRGCLMLNLLVMLYATNWSVVKIADENFDPEVFSALRFAVAAVPFLPWLKDAVADKELTKAGAELGFWSFLGYQAQAIALTTTDASKCAFLSTFTVLAVPLVASMDGQSIKLRTVLAALGAVAGVGLLEQGGTHGMCVGDAWASISALIFAVQIYRTEVVSRRLPSDSQMGLMSTLMVSLGLMSCAASVVEHPPSLSLDLLSGAGLHNVFGLHHGLHQLSPFLLAGSVIYTGLCTTALTLWLELAALQNVEASDCAVIYSMEPLLGAGIAWVTLGERWGPAGWLGAALIVASTMSAQMGDSESSEHAEATTPTAPVQGDA
ncbi:uncharacterized protein LOC142355596 [Convolutriloba macropyga]|uniref:uncharacterized protein LOC142355596 n=1 Tax=Convolutriloba macropyga TaxID=536237 RepID=UPI003F528370